MDDTRYKGFLFIGDPHVCSRPVEYRKDDYPRTILRKLGWALDYARDCELKPVLLGDIFDYPRDNANWLLVELMRLFEGGVSSVCGNHDSKENVLADNDTISVLVESGHIYLLDRDGPWRGVMRDRPVMLGGTSWIDRLPREVERPDGAFVFWVAHHNIGFPGYDAKRFDCYEIPGVDVVINGHIHRHLEDVIKGQTRWINPGSIARVARSEATRGHRPAVLRVDVNGSGWSHAMVELPCDPYEQVFHAQVQELEEAGGGSNFIRGLRELESVRTAGGAGLRDFLERNIGQFDPPVGEAILQLANEVLQNG